MFPTTFFHSFSYHTPGLRDLLAGSFKNCFHVQNSFPVGDEGDSGKLLPRFTRSTIDCGLLSRFIKKGLQMCASNEISANCGFYRMRIKLFS